MLLKAALLRGPGSKAARQLFGILTSFLKAGTALSSRGGSSGSSGGGSSGSNTVAAGGAVVWGPIIAVIDQISEQCRLVTATTLITLLLPMAKAGDADGGSSDSSSSPDGSNDGGSSDSGSGSSDSAGTNSSPASKWEGVDVAVLSPWLVLFGRCLVQWGRQLLQSAQLGTLSRPFLCPTWGLADAFGITESLSVFLTPVKAGEPWGGGISGWPLFQSLVEVVIMALHGLKEGSSSDSGGDSSSSGDAGDGSSTGSSSSEGTLFSATLGLRLLYGSVVDLHKAGRFCEAPLQQFAESMLEVGQLFCSSLPLPGSSCNNPLCMNLGGGSEAALARSKCSGCRAASYCSPGCLKKHWKQHKRVCGKQLAANMS